MASSRHICTWWRMHSGLVGNVPDAHDSHLCMKATISQKNLSPCGLFPSRNWWWIDTPPIPLALVVFFLVFLETGGGEAVKATKWCNKSRPYNIKMKAGATSMLWTMNHTHALAHRPGTRAMLTHTLVQTAVHANTPLTYHLLGHQGTQRAAWTLFCKLLTRAAVLVIHLFYFVLFILSPWLAQNCLPLPRTLPPFFIYFFYLSSMFFSLYQIFSCPIFKTNK